MRLLLFILFFGFSPLLLWSQDSPSQPVNIKAKYDSAQVAFTQFEKKHGGFIQTKNVKMHYLEWGNPRHTPFIWIHGSFTNAYEFADLAKELVQKGYYVIAIDYYGHGQTPIPAQDVSLYHVADDINTLMSVKKTVQSRNWRLVERGFYCYGVLRRLSRKSTRISTRRRWISSYQHPLPSTT